MPKVEGTIHRNASQRAHTLFRKPRFVTEFGERHAYEFDRHYSSLRLSWNGSQTFLSSSEARLLYAMLGRIYEPGTRPAHRARRLQPGEASTLEQLDRPAVTDPEEILYRSEPENGRPGNPYCVYHQRRRMFLVVRDIATGDGGKRREAVPEALQFKVQKALVRDIAVNYGLTPDPTTQGYVWFMVAKDVALTAFPDMAAYNLRPTLDDRLADDAAAIERMEQHRFDHLEGTGQAWNV